MVALLIASLFLAVLLVDLYRERHRPAVAEMAIRKDRFPLPGQGVFVTGNHLTAVLTGNGMIWLEPDSFARVAAGPRGIVKASSAGPAVHAGDPLFAVKAGDYEGSIAAPFNGEVVKASDDGILYRPNDLAAAVRSMRIGETAKEWWDEERHRLGRFLAEIHGEQFSLADGGDLVEGYAAHLPAVEFRRFSRIFLERPHR